MKIYTRTGDHGQTSLVPGHKISKANALVSCLGDLDELNCFMGLSLAFSKNRLTKKILPLLQNLIFSAGAELSGWKPVTGHNFRKIGQSDVTLLENYIDQIEEALESLKNFILPGGSESAAFLHVARAVCRRAERTLVGLNLHKKVKNSFLLPLLNRTSDLLFILARNENRGFARKETVWQKNS